jgi:hypothetical protein
MAGVAGWVLVCMGCTQNQPTDIHKLKVPANFDYSTTQDVSVTATVTDADGNVMPGTEVVVGGTGDELVEGNIYTRGITDNQGQFQGMMRIPAWIPELRVQASVFGIANKTDVPITNNAVSVAFGPGS